EGTELEHQSLADMIANLDKVPEAMRMSVRNNGGGHFNHSLFWGILSPNSEEKSGVIDDIKAQWGTLDEFKNEFANK
ncbi:superoxide dismutase, partial [Staphylococcus aureus]|nr:superoxide dismutase [Staphylococcus aureus]